MTGKMNKAKSMKTRHILPHLAVKGMMNNGASVITYSSIARNRIKQIEKMGITHYPVCIAKTQYSFSADPKIYGAVNNFEFHIKDIVINNGAEMIVAIAGEILRMPGLPKEPQALHIDIVDGEIEGLS